MSKNMKIKSLISILMLLFVVTLGTAITSISIGYNSQKSNEANLPASTEYDLSETNWISGGKEYAVADASGIAGNLTFDFDDTKHEAIFTGLTGDAGGKESHIGKTLRIPSVVKKTGEATEYKVTAIDTSPARVKTSTSGTTGQGTISNWFTSASIFNYKDFDRTQAVGTGSRYISSIQEFGSHITAVIVPNTVTKMNIAAFYGMASLVYFETPFIGTERGVDNVSYYGRSLPMHIMFSPNYSKSDDTYVTPYSKLSSSASASTYSGTNEAQLIADIYNTSTANKFTYQLPCNLKRVKVTNDTGIGNRAFRGINSLEYVELNDEISTIGESAFNLCKNLLNVHLPAKITKLNSELFSECESLGKNLGTDAEPIANPVHLPLKLLSIPDSCFGGCKSLETVYAPNSVEVIGAKAFQNCEKLNNIVIFEGNLETKEESVIEATVNSGFDLPESLKEIGTSAFGNCVKLKAITIPSKQMETMGNYVFEGCTQLKEITLPFIGNKAGNYDGKAFGVIFNSAAGSDYYFAKQNGQDCYIPEILDSVVITGETYFSAGSMANMAFTDVDDDGKTFYDGVTKIAITNGAWTSSDNGVKKIEQAAFAGNAALNRIELPFIGTGSDDSHVAIPFGKIDDLTTSTLGLDAFDGSSTYYVPVALKTIEIKDLTLTEYNPGGSYMEYEKYAVNPKHDNKRVQKTVQSGSFANLKFIEIVIFPSDTYEMRSAVFSGNERLKSISVPFVGRRNELFRPGWPNYAWSWWTIDREMRNSLEWLFSDTYSNDSFYADTTLSYMSSRIRYIPNTLEEVNVLNAKYVGYTAFNNLTSLKRVKFYSKSYGNELVSIEEGALRGCSSLEMLTLPFVGSTGRSSDTNGYSHTIPYLFGTDAYSTGFYKSQLYGKTCYIPDTLDEIVIDGNGDVFTTTINAYAFKDLKTLTKIDLTNAGTITTINPYSFAGCSSLNKLSYKEGSLFTNISDHAFYNCTNLTSISQMVPKYADSDAILNVGNYAFAGTGISGVEFEKLGTTVGAYAFAGCLGLTSVQITNNIKVLKEGVFADCIFLDYVKFDSSINDMGTYMFKNCTKLANINLEGILDTDKGVPDGMFYGCKSLVYNGIDTTKGVVLSSGITKIGAEAFYGCESLAYFQIPSSVTEIGKDAFTECRKLGNIIIPKTTTVIKSPIFSQTIGNGFVIYVYDKEEDRPATWEKGWNNNNPVLIIDYADDAIFEFELSSTYGGYIITGIKTTSYSGDRKLPETHLSADVVGIKAGVFGSKTTGWNYKDLTSLIIPEKYYYFEEGCFNTNARIDLYFEANSTSSTLAEFVSNPNAYLRGGLVYYGELWDYDKADTYKVTPMLLMNQMVYEFNPYIETNFNAKYFDEKTYPIVAVKSKAYIKENADVNVGPKSNIIYEYDSETWMDFVKGVYGTDNALIFEDDEATRVNVGYGLFNYKYTDNYQAGTAKVSITLNRTVYDKYLSETTFAPYQPKILGATISRSFTISPTVITLFGTWNDEKGQVSFFPGNYFSENNFTKIFDNKAWTSSGLNLMNAAVGQTVGEESFTEYFTITGSIYTKSEQAGTYTIHGTDNNSEIGSSLNVYRNGVNVTRSIIFDINLKVKISPKTVTLMFYTDNNYSNYTSDAGIYKYSYRGYKVEIEPTAAAYWYNPSSLKYERETLAEVKTECTAEFGDINGKNKWEPGNAIYGAKAYLYGTFSNRNYVLSDECKYVADGGAKQEYIVGRYQIVKAKVVIDYLNTAYLIGTEDTNWQYDKNITSNMNSPIKDSKDNQIGHMKVTGLGTGSIISGTIISYAKEGTTFTAYENDTSGYLTGSYDTNSNSNLKIGWKDSTYEIYTKYDLDNDGVLDKVDESNYYEVISLNAKVVIVYNTFEYDLTIDGTTYASVDEGSATPTYTEKDGYIYIEYPTDGTEVSFEAIISNLKTSNNGITVTGTVLGSDIKYNGGYTKISFGTEANKDVKLALDISRDRFTSVHKNVWIRVVKSNIQCKHIVEEYDGYNYSVDSDLYTLLHKDEDVGFIIKRGTIGGIQSVTIELCIKKSDGKYEKLTSANNPFAPGKYYVHVVAGEHPYFNEFDDYVELEITQREITLYVNKVYPENYSSGNKLNAVYDGNNYFIQPDNDRLKEFNKLLADDTFSGIVMTWSASPAIYDTQVDGDWIWSPDYSVFNPTLGDITSYYKVTLVGEFEIIPIEIDYTIDGDYSDYYDGFYHSINITVDDHMGSATKPYCNYNIGYIVNPDPDPGTISAKDDTEESPLTWSSYTPEFMAPGHYVIYIKIWAENYKTVYLKRTIDIIAKDPTYDLPACLVANAPGAAYAYSVTYTGYANSLEFVNLNPWNTKVMYSLVMEGQAAGTYSSVAPTVTDIGKYKLYAIISCTNYNTITEEIVFDVNEDGLPTLDASDYSIDYYGGTTTPTNYSSSTTQAESFYNNADHYYEINYDESKYPGSAYTITYSSDNKLTWVTGPIKFRDVSETGSYTVWYRLKVAGRQTVEGSFEIIIKKATFNLTVDDLDINYDGLTHYATINGLSDYSYVTDLKIYYTDNYAFTGLPLTNSAWKTTNIGFIHANTTPYKVYITVTSKNFVDKQLTATIKINQSTLDLDFPDPCNVEYLKRAVTVSDLGIESSVTVDGEKIEVNHNGAVSVLWYNGQLKTISGVDKLVHDEAPIAAPSAVNTSDTSYYFVDIYYEATDDCAAAHIYGYFKIIKRKVIADYNTESEYTGKGQTPVVTAKAQNGKALPDALYIVPYRADGVSSKPVEINTDPGYLYEFKFGGESDMTYYDTNYEIVNTTGYYKITPIKVTIRIGTAADPYSTPYNGKIWELTNVPSESDSVPYSNTIWKDFTWNSKFLKYGETEHIFTASIKTNSSAKGTYVYCRDDEPIKPQRYVSVSDVVIYDENGNIVTDKYEISYSIYVKIAFPEIKATFEDETIYYDGTGHTLLPEYEEGVETEKITAFYKYASDVTAAEEASGAWRYSDGWKEAGGSLAENYTDVGSYKIYIYLSSFYYDDYFACATLTIEKATPKVKITDFDQTYNNQNKSVEYTVSNILNIGNATNVRYYRVKDTNETELRALYASFSDANPNYYIYKDYAQTYMVNAGDYYAVVYYKGTNNWYANYAIKLVTVKQRPIYFVASSYTFDDSHIYNGEKVVIGISNKYTLNGEKGVNTESDATIANSGLLDIHNFKINTLTSSSFRTVSSDAGYYVGDDTGIAYATDLEIVRNGFEFNDAKIINNLSVDVTENYRPIITGDNLIVVINRAPIDPASFTVSYAEKEYDGVGPRPNINTPSDGKIVYEFYLAKDVELNADGSVKNANVEFSKQLQETVAYRDTDIDACKANQYYYVKLTQEAGKNYEALGDYRYVYARIVPKEVDAVWENMTVTFNGAYQLPTVYFTDVFDTNVDLSVKALIDWEYTDKMINSGSYCVTAFTPDSTKYKGIDNYHVNNLGSIADTSAKYFVIENKHYTISLKDETGNNIVHNINTAWTLTFDRDYFGADWGLDNVYIQHTTTDKDKAILLTKSAAAGNYKSEGDFIWVDYIYYKDPKSGEIIDVTDSITFDLEGAVVIEYEGISYTISKKLTVAYGPEYELKDFVFLTNPSYTTNGISILYYEYDYEAGAYKTQQSSTWKIRDVGHYKVSFTIQYLDDTISDEIEVEIVAAESKLEFNKDFSKQYDSLPVSWETLKNSISTGLYNGSVSDLVYTFYEVGYTTPLITRDGTNDIFGTSKEYPTNAGSYRVVITNKADGVDGACYEALYKEITFKITPTTITYKFNREVIDFGSTVGNFDIGTSLYDSGNITQLNNVSLPTGYKLNIKIQGVVDSSGNDVPIDHGMYTTHTSTDTKTVQIKYLAGVSEYSFVTLFKSYDAPIEQNAKFKISWSITKETTGVVTVGGEETTITTIDDFTYNYNLLLDFELESHYPRINTVYDFKENTYGNTIKPAYVTAKYGIYAYVDDISVNYNGSEQHGELLAGSYNSSIILDSTVKSNIHAGFGPSDVDIDKETRSNPGSYDIDYRVTYTGFEPYDGTYNIKIGKIGRTTEKTYTGSEIAAEYYEQEYKIVVLKDKTDDYGVYLVDYLGNKIKDESGNDAKLYSIKRDTKGGALSDDDVEFSVKITRKNSSAIAIMKNRGTYKFTVTASETNNYLASDPIVDYIEITPKTICIKNNIEADNLQPLLDGTKTIGYVHNYNAHTASSLAQIVNSNSPVTKSNIYDFYYYSKEDKLYNVEIDDLDVNAILKTDDVVAGVYSPITTLDSRVGSVNIDSFRVVKDGVDVTSNYQVICPEVRITIDMGKIEIEVLKNEYDYDGEAKSLVIKVTPEEAAKNVTYTTSKVTDAKSYSETKAGTYSVKVSASLTNYRTEEKYETLIINQIEHKLDIPKMTRDYNGSPMALPEMTTSNSGITVTSGMATWYLVEDGGALRDVNEPPTEVGSYQVWITVPTDSEQNYKQTTFIKEFEITTRGLILNWDRETFVYDGTKQYPKATVADSVFNDESTDGVEIDYKYSDLVLVSGGDKDSVTVGKYTLEAYIVGSSNFKLDSKTSKKTYTITQRVVTVVLNQSRSFDSAKAGGVSYDTGLGTYVFHYNEKDADENIIGFTANNIASGHYIPTSNYIASRFTTVGIYTAVTQFVLQSSKTNALEIKAPGVGGTEIDVTDNYDIRYNLYFNINYSKIEVSVTGINKTYDGLAETIEVKVLNSDAPSGYTIYYATEYDSSLKKFTTTNPSFKNAGTSMVYYMVTKDGYSPLYGEDCYAVVKIDKADGEIGWKDDTEIEALTKVYDGVPVKNPGVIYSDWATKPRTVTYTYYKLNGDDYEPMKSSVVNVGDYKLVVSLGDGENYTNGSISVPFTIKQREITAMLTNSEGLETKVYDGVRWRAEVKNAVSTSLSDATDPSKGAVSVDITRENGSVTHLLLSNVVTGQRFTGTIQTVSANAKSYTSNADYEFLEDSFRVYSGATEVQGNYYVTFDMDVTITKANIEYKVATFVENDITYKGYYGEYDGEAHSVKVNVIDPAGAQVYYSFDPSKDRVYDLTKYSVTAAGQKTVYFKIEYENFNTVYDELVIKITGLKTSGKLTLDSEYTYNAQPFSDPKLTTMSNGTKTYSYYNADDYDVVKKTPKEGAVALSEAPYNVGNYVVVVKVADDGVYDPFTIIGQFAIIKQEVAVNWEGLSVVYNGDAQKPKAYYNVTYLDGSGATQNKKVELIVTSEVTPMRAVGTYLVTAKFDTSKDDATIKYGAMLSSNYQLASAKEDTATKKLVHTTATNGLKVSTAEFEITKKKITAPTFEANQKFTYGEDPKLKDTNGNIYDVYYNYDDSTDPLNGTLLGVTNYGATDEVDDDYVIKFVNDVYDFEPTITFFETVDVIVDGVPVYEDGKIKTEVVEKKYDLILDDDGKIIGMISKGTSFDKTDNGDGTWSITTTDPDATIINVSKTPATQTIGGTETNYTGVVPTLNISLPIEFKLVLSEDKNSDGVVVSTHASTLKLDDNKNTEWDGLSGADAAKNIVSQYYILKASYPTADEKIKVAFRSGSKRNNTFTNSAITPLFDVSIVEIATSLEVAKIYDTTDMSKGIIKGYEVAYYAASDTSRATPVTPVAKGTYVAVIKGVNNYSFTSEVEFVIEEAPAAIIKILDKKASDSTQATTIGFITAHQDNASNLYEISFTGSEATDRDTSSRTKNNAEGVFLGRIQAQTKISDILDQLNDADSLKVFSFDTKSNKYVQVEKSSYDSTFISTSDYIALYNSEGKEVDRIYVLIFGDTDCDGSIKISDYNVFVKYYSGNKTYNVADNETGTTKRITMEDCINDTTNATKYELIEYCSLFTVRYDSAKGTPIPTVKVGAYNTLVASFSGTDFNAIYAAPAATI